MEPSPLPLLVQPETLNAKLESPDVLVVFVGAADVFEDLHIPGAVHVTPQALVRAPGCGLLPDDATLETTLRTMGLAPHTQVVAYDDEGGGWASRLLWTLDVLGHSRFALLDGGLTAWLAGGWPTQDGPSIRRNSDYVARTQASRWLNAHDVRRALGDDTVVIVDARSRGEYEGHDVRGARGGHIPGAVHLDWLALMDRKRHLRLHDAATLRELCLTRGITPECRVIVYCHTHHRSSLTWFALRLLAYPRVLAYPGSWAQWSTLPSFPIESETPPVPAFDNAHAHGLGLHLD